MRDPVEAGGTVVMVDLHADGGSNDKQRNRIMRLQERRDATGVTMFHRHAE